MSNETNQSSGSLLSDRQTISLGRCLCGIETKIHITFLFLLGVEVLVSFLFVAHTPLFVLFVFLLYGPVLLLTVIVHELGHALVTKKYGGEVGGIVVWPLGGIAICGPTDGGVFRDFLVAIAGPLTHIPQMLIWLGIYALVTSGNFTYFRSQVIYLDILTSGAAGFFAVLSSRAFWLNCWLLVLNLFVPAYPLDGGRCLAALLIMGGVSVEKAAKITAWTAMVIGATMFGIGIYGFLFTYYPNSVLAIIVGVIVMASGKGLIDQVKNGRIGNHPVFGRPLYGDREQVTTVGSGGGSAEEGETATEMTQTPQETAEARVV